MLTPAHRYKVGKWDSEHGVTASINFTRSAVRVLLVSFVKQLYCLGHTLLSDSQNFISLKVVWKATHQIFPHQNFPPYSTFKKDLCSMYN